MSINALIRLLSVVFYCTCSIAYSQGNNETYISIPKKTTLEKPYSINSKLAVGPINTGVGDTTITNEWVIYEVCIIGDLPGSEYSIYLRDSVIKKSVIKLNFKQAASLIEFSEKHHAFPFKATSLAKSEHFHWMKGDVEYFLKVDKKYAVLKAKAL